MPASLDMALSVALSASDVSNSAPSDEASNDGPPPPPLLPEPKHACQVTGNASTSTDFLIRR